MFRSSWIVVLVLISFSNYAQEINATIKTVNTVTPGNDITVEITVNKTDVTGFVKYYQALPKGYSASDIDSKGGSFTFADDGAKIIWVSPPNVDQFVMSYKISTPINAKGSISVGGKFTYVVGSERKVFEIVPQIISVGQADAVTKMPVKEIDKPAQSTQKEPNPVIEKKPDEIKKTVEPKKSPAPVIITTPSKAPVTASAAITAGRTYRVQIGAFTLKPNIDAVPEPSSILLDNGMTKYFSGNFKTYEEAAKRKKEMIEKGFPGAFIVSFENGKILK